MILFGCFSSAGRLLHLEARLPVLRIPSVLPAAMPNRRPVVAGGGFLSFLKDANLNGCHVDFNVNPVRPDARGGTKGDIARAARVWIDVDGGVEEVFERLG